MKLSIILIFAILLYQNGISQTYDSIANRHFKIKDQNVNFTDSLGQRQGPWVEYRLLNPYKDQDQWLPQPDNTAIRKLGEGYYINNKKSGLWEYYYDGPCVIYVSSTENYSEDGKVEEWIYEYTVVNNYSIDSNQVHSKIFFNRDTILIACENKLTCLATVHGKELLKFDFKDLNYEQCRMYLGEYQRAILKLREESDY